MKRISLLVIALTVVFSLSISPLAEAKRGGGFGGGYKSPKRTYTQTPAKPADKNVSNTNPGKNTGTTTPVTGNRGFFTGGGLMRGLMIGGLAGLLFGTMFANMGAFGNLLGLLVNVFAIYILFIVIRGIVRYYWNQRKPNPNDPNRRY
ncbi:MAG: hypothetical protein WD424_03135 [Paenibacillaceae bacterium]